MTLSGSDLVTAGAVLTPAGFLSVLGRDPQRPSRLRGLLWVGAAALTVGLVGAGLGPVLAGAR